MKKSAENKKSNGKNQLQELIPLTAKMKSPALRDPQIEALQMGVKYYIKCSKQNSNKSKYGAALVQMPTGTGKTGIMAILSRCVSDIGFTLIIAPRVAIRDQIYKQVSGHFFKRWNIENEVPKKVINFSGSHVELYQKSKWKLLWSRTEENFKIYQSTKYCCCLYSSEITSITYKKSKRV